MTSAGIAFFTVSTVLMLALPRRYAVVPLILSAAYMTGGEVVDIGGANFTIPRLLVSVGLLRALIKRERIEGGLQAVDRLMLLWGALLIATSAFHTSEAWMYRLGIVWSEMGCYFLARIFLRDLEEVRRAFKVLSIALLPLAIALVVEKTAAFNCFSVLHGVSENAIVRVGHVRATGPFAHPILAGTVGAFYFALGLSLWQGSRRHAWLAGAAGAAIVWAAASSGPLLMLVFIVLGCLAWPVRNDMRAVRWLLLIGLLVLNAAMSDPVYFLMARIDLFGGSQGWFRAQLIRSSIEHLPEWWLAGTDHTRHWMQSGIAVDARHTDMTNHILSMGVKGGLPLMFVFILILVKSFQSVGSSIRRADFESNDRKHFVWILGAWLFGFLMNFLSITLFDQSVTFFWFVVAAIASAAATSVREVPASVPVDVAAPFITVNDFAVRTDRSVVEPG